MPRPRTTPDSLDLGPLVAATSSAKRRERIAFSGRLTQEAADAMNAIRAATGWKVQDIFSVALVNLVHTPALETVIRALRDLRKDLNVTSK